MKSWTTRCRTTLRPDSLKGISSEIGIFRTTAHNQKHSSHIRNREPCHKPSPMIGSRTPVLRLALKNDRTPTMLALNVPSPALDSIDRHPTRNRSVAQIRHLRHIGFFILAFQFPTCDMWLESSAKVQRTHNRIDNGGDDQKDSDDGEGGKRPPNREVCQFSLGLVHSDQLEDKVGQGDKVKHLKIGKPLTSGREKASPEISLQ